MGIYMDIDEKSRILLELYDKYITIIKNTCLYNNISINEIDDCMQDIFIEAFDRFDNIYILNNDLKWILKITGTVVKRYTRKYQKKKQYEIYSEESEYNELMSDQSFEDGYIENEYYNEIIEYVYKRLKKQEKELYNDFYKKHLTLLQISEKERIKISAAKMRLQRLNIKIKLFSDEYTKKVDIIKY